MGVLVIGDVHGCCDELRRLIDHAELSADGLIVTLGDVVDRGPATFEVLDFLRNTPNTTTLMGNHERKHVRSFRGETAAALSQRITRHLAGEDAYPGLVDYFDGLPRHLELPEAILVHASLEPGVPLEAQRETVVVGTLSGEAYLERTYARPWFELYDGPKPIIVGHRDYLGNGQPFVRRDRVYAIDTGCCRGGTLTGLLLPEFRLLSVPSARDYWMELRARFGPVLRRTPDLMDSRWEGLALASQPSRAETEAGAGELERPRAQAILAAGEDNLRHVGRYVDAERDRLLAELHAGSDYVALDDREQARLYAGLISPSPIARLLYRARLAALTFDDLRRLLPTPSAAAEMAAGLSLLRETGTRGGPLGPSPSDRPE